jgi:hypothetical protein
MSCIRYLGPNGCLSFLVVQTISSLEQKANRIDADGDGKVSTICAAIYVCNFVRWRVQVDLNELREFLSEAGALDIFGANSVQEVMSIFDTDGNGSLEPQELQTLMEFIEEEKARMLALGGNKDSGASKGAESSLAKQKTSGSINVTERKMNTIAKLEESMIAVDADGDGNVDLEEVSGARGWRSSFTSLPKFSCLLLANPSC